MIGLVGLVVRGLVVDGKRVVDGKELKMGGC
jgi:hypothetical protein